jgi:hypothetical protein
MFSPVNQPSALVDLATVDEAEIVGLPSVVGQGAVELDIREPPRDSKQVVLGLFLPHTLKKKADEPIQPENE